MFAKAVLIAAAALAATSAQGKDLFDSMINQPGLGWSLYGPNQSAKQVSAPSDVPGGAAVRVTVTKPGANPYDVGATYPNTKPIAKGDTVVTMVFMRAPDAGDGKTIPIPLGISEANAPYTQIANETVQVGPTWKRYFVAGVAPKTFRAGEARISVQLAEQVVELGAAFLMDPGPGFDTSTLPRN
jgi:hypothetical protein